MPAPLTPGTTDLAGQIAIVQGVDSNVFQTLDSSGAPLRHPAGFTSAEGSVAFAAPGRDHSSDVRFFGRALTYEPLGPDFESRAARGGVSYLGSSRLDRRTTLVTTLLGSIGSLQAVRGTDGVNLVDPVSTRRSTWNLSGSETFAVETSRATSVRVLSGMDVVGTLAETPPAQPTVRRGLDLLILRGRLSVLHKVDVRTIVEGALLGERLHSGYTLVRGDPTSPSLGPIDTAAATVTGSVARLLDPKTTAMGTLGLTFAAAVGERSSIFPVASAGLVRQETAWTASALASLQYTMTQPRVGPGPTASLALVVFGKPLSGPSHELLEMVAEASGQRTVASFGVNDGSSVTIFGGGVTARVRVYGSLGVMIGYDVRSARVVAADGSSPPLYVRHLGFVGLSYAWAGAGSMSSLPTLARPASTPFSPL